MPVYAELEPIILEAAQFHRLPPTLIKAVIKSESILLLGRFPQRRHGVDAAYACHGRLFGGAGAFQSPGEHPRRLPLPAELIDLFGGNLPLALASYNAGFQRVIDCGYRIPAIKETQDFVTTVMGRYVAEEKRGRQPLT